MLRELHANSGSARRSKSTLIEIACTSKVSYELSTGIEYDGLTQGPGSRETVQHSSRPEVTDMPPIPGLRRSTVDNALAICNHMADVPQPC